MTTTKINQKEYLKKYLSSNIGDEKKKKKKKSKSQKSVKIIDDDVDLSKIETNEDDLDIFQTGEDAPQIVGVIDDRPPELQALDYKNSNKWKAVNNDDFSNMLNSSKPSCSVSRLTKENSPLKRIKKTESGRSPSYLDNEDLSTHIPRDINKPNDSMQRRKLMPREYAHKQIKHKEDKSSKTERQTSSKYSDDDLSPKRYRKQRENDADLSPIRNKNKRSSEDLSPKRYKSRRDSTDVSSPKRSEARRNYANDFSSKRSKHRNYSQELSPKQDKTRRTEDNLSLKSKTNRDYSPKQTKKSRFDLPYQRRSTSRDRSPPKEKNQKSSRNRLSRSASLDLSPPRKTTNKIPDRHIKSRDSYSRYTPSPPRRHIKIKQESESPPPTHSKVMTKTLDGKTAGLSDAKALRVENAKFKEREQKLFEKMTDEMSGRHADIVMRDRSTGKRRNFAEESEKQRKKDEKEKAKKAIYDRWGAGLKQVEEHKERLEEISHEMNKPLARYSNDEDLDEYLKKQERHGDPMLEYIRQKEREKNKKQGIPEMPRYEGSFPDNRFNIRPGYRWDGVDRSNGFEKKWFETISKRKAVEEEAYRYSTEDM